MKNIKTLPVERKIYYVLLENFEISLMKIKQNLDTDCQNEEAIKWGFSNLFNIDIDKYLNLEL